jgi:GntR family transcriptional regulator/MocR family aminotransferase
MGGRGPAPPARGPAVVLDREDAAPLYRQVRDRLREQILDGQLEAGTRLPSTRVLAAELGVSRTTTALAYDLLLLEGCVESRVGAGTRVADVRARRPEAGPTDGGCRPPWLARRGHALLHDSTRDGPRPEPGAAAMFRVGEPDVALFPFATWARLLAGHARRSLQAASAGLDPRGHRPLREAIAAHLGVTRGVRCAPDQVLVTHGARAALDLVSRVLLDPGDAAWVEDPGCRLAGGALVAAGARPVAVPVDGEGLDVEGGRARCPDARLAVVTPARQFPTGAVMSPARRQALLEWAGQAGAWVVEDGSGGDYRFGGRPPAALQGQDADGRVIHVGGFRSVLHPSARLGYLVAPAALGEGLLAARRCVGVHPPLLEQLALADLFAGGHLARHLRRTRAVYQERRRALLDALRREVGDAAEVVAPEAGLHLVAWLPAGVDGRRVAREAAALGLDVEPVSRFSLRPPARDGLLLGFASHGAPELRAGAAALAGVLRARRRYGATTSP